MNTTKLKLQSKRGASIMLALLLLLVCLLAGIASLTAASANMGRHGYMRETHQKYLAVSSAAKLVQEQLDGFKLARNYEREATSEYDLDKTPEGFKVSSSSKKHGDIEYSKDGASIANISSYENKSVLKFVRSDFEHMLADAFYNAVQSYSNPVLDPDNKLWSEEYAENDKVTADAINLEVECAEIDMGDETVKISIKFEDAARSYRNGEIRTFTVEISCGDYFVNTSGEISITAPAPNVSIVDDNYTYADPDSPDPLNPDMITVPAQKIDKSTQETTIEIKMNGSISKGAAK